MENYYGLLGVNPSASYLEIKKAFREKAKRLHPDLAGGSDGTEMRRLLAAYKALSELAKQREYDYSFIHLRQRKEFNYRDFLASRTDDPASQAKLVLYDLFHGREDSALAVWKTQGGLGFAMKQYLDRGDWMDGVYVLAEELHKRKFYYETFVLLVDLLEEERRLPYFRHFTVDVEKFLKNLVRLRLKAAVDETTWLSCLRIMSALGFAPKKKFSSL
jgi:curved DNA-binding protein CbpA